MIPEHLRHDGTYLAIDDASNATLWPRELYPEATDALLAEDAIAGEGALLDAELYGIRVRLVWAHRVVDHPEGEWWLWTDAPGRLPEWDPDEEPYQLEGPPIECWEVRP